jgi:hypothetical protein
MVGREDAANRSLKPAIPHHSQVPRGGKHRWAGEGRAPRKPPQAMLDAEMQAVSTWSRDGPNTASSQPGSSYAGHSPEEERPDAVTLRRVSK